MIFTYTATNRQARRESGTLEAEGAVEAYDMLRQQGLYPTHLKAKRTSLKDKIAMKLLKSFLTTQQGWLTRKGLELVSIGIGAASAYAIQHGVSDEIVSSGGAFFTAVGAYLVSLALSAMADQANKEAEPPAK
jgi:hypothetical protein